MKPKQRKPIFFCGLGEHPSSYKTLTKFFNIIPIDWNNIKLPKHNADIAVGFSMGAVLACEHALKHKVKTLILCSMTTGVESLKKIKAGDIIFLIGEKEKWVIRDTKRLLKTVENRARIIIVPRAGHKIDKNYRNILLKVIKRILFIDFIEL